MEVVDNVGGAQSELLKYYASVSSNRWLMLKIFGVLIVFFLRKFQNICYFFFYLIHSRINTLESFFIFGFFFFLHLLVYPLYFHLFI